EPFFPPIEYCGPKPGCSPPFPIRIDLVGSSAELLVIAVQTAIMVQVLHRNLKATVGHRSQVFRRDLVALFGNNLERRFNPKAIVNIHKRPAEISPRNRLHVMRHDCTAGCAIWPKPNEGEPISATCSER